MNHITYHHYGATILDAPIAQLRCGIQTMLSIPSALEHAQGHRTEILEESTGRVAGSHTLIYRSSMDVPEIAEYIATWTLACTADAPHTTIVEWMREYRPSALANQEQIGPFVSALIDQDREIATRFAAAYGNPEVIYIDYTLGGA